LESSRGVGILINRNVFEQLLEEVTDFDNNFLLIKVKLSTGIWLLGAVYGPNDNNQAFFTDLGAGIRRLNCENKVIAGDWNCTWDPRPVDQNLDTINMASIPSRQRSLWLGQLAADTDMTDPFRILHPIKKEYTYIPNARTNLNRSRLDFFLVNKSMAEKIIDCSIASALSST
jgi:exonuclease III